MTKRNIKLFIGVSVLLAYIGMGVFGLFEFNHSTKMPMTNCPYAQNGSSLCESNFDHINNWQQFSSVTFASLFVLSILILGVILYFSVKKNLLNQKLYFYRWKYYINNKIPYSFQNRIIKWLSLFENSPSLYAVYSFSSVN